MSNMSQIGRACAAYMNDHNQQLPAKIEDLVPQYLPDGKALLHPGDKNPMAIGKGLKTSYHFAGALPALPDAQVIIAYEKRTEDKVRNALFADGHVETMAEGALKARLRKGIDLLKQKDWDKIGHERRKELEAFYAGKR